MRETLRSTLKLLIGRWPMLLLRLALGGLFMASSLSKLGHMGQFTTSVLSYHMLPEALARPFATALPFAELFIGCSLVLGTFVLLSSALTIALSLSFAIANIYALVRHVGGDTCPCLGSLLTMSHSAALAIDFAMAAVAALLIARHRKAEWLGVGQLLRRDRLGLNKVRETTMKVILVLMCMVVAIGLLGVRKTPAAQAIDAALVEGRIVLVFRYGGDAEAISDDFGILADVQSRFGDILCVVRCKTGQDPWADRKFPIDEQIPTLFVITGQDSNRLAIRYRFESTLNAGMIETAIHEILDEADA